MHHNNPAPLTKYDLPLLCDAQVAEKTDGERFTLEIKGTTSNVPGISSSVNINALFDCEKVNDQVYVFDVIVDGERDNVAQVCWRCFNIPLFGSYDEYFDYIHKDGVTLIPKMFVPATMATYVWQKFYEYPGTVDGLIFTLPQKTFKWKPLRLLTVDFYVKERDTHFELYGSLPQGKSAPRSSQQGQDIPYLVTTIQKTGNSLQIVPNAVNEFRSYKNTWQFVKYRPDKTERLKTKHPRYGNRIQNIRLLQQLIADPVTFGDLKCTTAADQIYYNPGASWKKKINRSRKLHGRIKYDLIKEYAKSKNIVDFGFGDGSDYNKYKSMAARVTGVEICPRNLMIARTMLKDRDQVLTRCPIGRFDTAFLFFSIHYFDMDLLCEDLCRCTTIVITCLDGSLITKNMSFDIGTIRIQDDHTLLVKMDSFAKERAENKINIDQLVQHVEKYCAPKKIRRCEPFCLSRYNRFSSLHKILVFQ